MRYIERPNYIAGGCMKWLDYGVLETIHYFVLARLHGTFALLRLLLTQVSLYS